MSVYECCLTIIYYCGMVIFHYYLGASGSSNKFMFSGEVRM